MPDDRSAATLLREVGLIADGPVWGRPRPARRARRVLIELAAPRLAPARPARIGKWLERVPELRLDGAGRRRRTSRPGSARSGSRRSRSCSRLHAGLRRGPRRRDRKTVPGDRKPAASGFWLHFLRSPAELRVWWAPTDAPEEYEDALLDAFADGVPAPDVPHCPTRRSSCRGRSSARRPASASRPGITNPLLPEVKAPGAAARTRIVDLPPAEADGARDEAKRGPPAGAGPGTGGIAVRRGVRGPGIAAQGATSRLPVARGPRPAPGASSPRCWPSDPA